MCCKNNHKRGLTSRQYQTARLNYSQNHPMKNPIIRAKVKASHKKRSELISQINKQGLPLCACGCGMQVRHKKSTFLKEHFLINRPPLTNERQKRAAAKCSDTAKRNIARLTPEQQKNRLQKSLHSNRVDHKLRGQRISAGKRGKKTNEVNIIIERLGKMSILEFQLYLSTKSHYVHKRFINYRNRYKCKNKV